MNEEVMRRCAEYDIKRCDDVVNELKEFMMNKIGIMGKTAVKIIQYLIDNDISSLKRFRKVLTSRSDFLNPLDLDEDIIEEIKNQLFAKFPLSTGRPSKVPAIMNPTNVLSMDPLAKINIKTKGRKTKSSTKKSPKEVISAPKVTSKRALQAYDLLRRTLLKYKELHGHLLVPSDFVVTHDDSFWPEEMWGFRLGSNVNDIRINNSFNDKREDLQSIGFIFNTANTNSTKIKKTKRQKADLICIECQLGDNKETLLICNGCNDRCLHLQCSKPPLQKVPEDGWYCQLCLEKLLDDI